MWPSPISDVRTTLDGVPGQPRYAKKIRVARDTAITASAYAERPSLLRTAASENRRDSNAELRMGPRAFRKSRRRPSGRNEHRGINLQCLG
jgi:hypothetical protein